MNTVYVILFYFSDNLEIGDNKLENIVSLCNGSASIALSNLYTLVALSESNNSTQNSPKTDPQTANPNSKVGNRVLASLVTSVTDMPKSPSSLSSTLSEIKTALNIKTKQNSQNSAKPQSKNLGKRNNKVDCSPALPDPKRFFPATFQTPQLNAINQKLTLPPIKQEIPINGDLLKMCPVKYIPISANGSMQGFVNNTIPTPIFVTQPLVSPPVTAIPLENAVIEQKSVFNGSSKESTAALNIGGNAVQIDQMNLTWNLHIVMLTGNEDLSLLVLSSLLQNGVKPLTIAQELVSFASLYIGEYTQ